LPPAQCHQLFAVFDAATKEETFRKLAGFKLDGVIQKTACPYLPVYNKGDRGLTGFIPSCRNHRAPSVTH
jgi:hypothetical protein